MFGAGAPSASHGMVASFPSSAVRLRGPLIIIGDEAGRKISNQISRPFTQRWVSIDYDLINVNIAFPGKEETSFSFSGFKASNSNLKSRSLLFNPQYARRKYGPKKAKRKDLKLNSKFASLERKVQWNIFEKSPFSGIPNTFFFNFRLRLRPILEEHFARIPSPSLHSNILKRRLLHSWECSASRTDPRKNPPPPSPIAFPQRLKRLL